MAICAHVTGNFHLITGPLHMLWLAYFSLSWWCSKASFISQCKDHPLRQADSVYPLVPWPPSTTYSPSLTFIRVTILHVFHSVTIKSISPLDWASRGWGPSLFSRPVCLQYFTQCLAYSWYKKKNEWITITDLTCDHNSLGISHGGSTYTTEISRFLTSHISFASPYLHLLHVYQFTPGHIWFLDVFLLNVCIHFHTFDAMLRNLNTPMVSSLSNFLLISMHSLFYAGVQCKINPNWNVWYLNDCCDRT